MNVERLHHSDVLGYIWRDIR